MGTKPKTVVGHVDADCFYCSAERVRDEFLMGKPVAVLGNQGACVIAKSYEMKARGVLTGEPIWDALSKCPEGIYIKRDFRWYDALSRLMFAAVRELFPKVEYYSIDEFFFEVGEHRRQDAQKLAKRLRDRVWEVAGVPVTVGIGRTRTLAKLISDSAKPAGARAVLDPAEEEAMLERLPVTEITGIAGRRQRRLSAWGIRNCLEFIRAERDQIRKLLTCSGELLWWELTGTAVTPVRPGRPRHQVLSRGGSFGEATDRPGVLFAWLVRNLERLIEELRYHGMVTGHLAVWVSYRDGRAGEGRANLAAPTDRFDLLLDAARPCLRRAWIPRGMANRMHLFADRLTWKREAQLGLFDPPGTRAEAVARMKEAINDRHGRFALRSAATLPLAAIYGDRSNGFDICDVRGKIFF
jgi:nucleotidyltransferase/DNA polymerase involved in DNA repair